LYLKKNEINLDTDMLDIPEFLWNNDKYQKNFSLIIKYFEIEKRINILNHRLNIIGELLYLLCEEINFRHISSLDWIIIILLAINVAILFFWDILAKDILEF
jgi:uncharacterized Rmd1/YagE family protein